MPTEHAVSPRDTAFLLQLRRFRDARRTLTCQGSLPAGLQRLSAFQIPRDRCAQTGFERYLRPKVAVAFNLGAVNRIASIMSGPIFHKAHQAFPTLATRAPRIRVAPPQFLPVG